MKSSIGFNQIARIISCENSIYSILVFPSATVLSCARIYRYNVSFTDQKFPSVVIVRCISMVALASCTHFEPIFLDIYFVSFYYYYYYYSVIIIYLLLLFFCSLPACFSVLMFSSFHVLIKILNSADLKSIRTISE